MQHCFIFRLIFVCYVTALVSFVVNNPANNYSEKEHDPEHGANNRATAIARAF